MIKNCKFQSGLACHILVNNLGPKIFTPSAGVCYVFNFGIIEGNVTANSPTADSGLQLDIDINSELNEFFKYASLPAPFRWLGGHAQLIYWKVAMPRRALSHEQTVLTYFARGNITVWLISCLTSLDSVDILILN